MQNFINLQRTAKIILAVVAAFLLTGGMYIGYASGGLFTVATDESLTSCQAVVGKWEEENPEIARAQEVYTGEFASVDYADKRFPKAKEYKEVIDTAVADGVDFAGHYAIAQWSCGNQCQEQAVVDVITGKLVAMGLPSEAGVGTHEQFAVLITNPSENLPKADELKKATFDTLTMLMNIPREYYVLAEGESSVYLKKLCTENPYTNVVI